jgi:hypothetical protein
MKRNKTTEEFYPDKMTCEEFIAELTSPCELEAFINNMKHLQDEKIPHEMYPEEWLEIFQAWRELHYGTKT